MAHANYDPESGDVVVHTVWTEKTLLKQVPGARWDARLKAWRVPAAWASLVILRGVLGEQLTLGDDIIRWAWKLREARVDPALELRAKLEPNDDRPLSTVDPNLYKFQVSGVQFMDVAGSGLLGDEMGAGKSATTLALIGHTRSLPALVICPNSVKFHWAREAARWLPEATPYVIDGGAVARRKILKKALTDPTALVIINVESVRLFSRLAPYGSIRLKRCRECDPRHGEEGLIASRCHVHRKELNDFEFHTVVLDEAHRCFPYNTPILTDEGWLSIGDVVEGQRATAVLSYSSTGVLEWQPITSRWRNPVGNLVRVKHTYGELVCTADHRVWTTEGYVSARELTIGSKLRVVSSIVHSEVSNRPILFKDVQQPANRLNSANTNPAELRVVSSNFSPKKAIQPILHEVMQQQVPHERPRSSCAYWPSKHQVKDHVNVSVVQEEVSRSSLLQQKNLLLGIVQFEAQARDDPQPDDKRSSSRKDEGIATRSQSLSEDLYGWQRTWNDQSAGTLSRSSQVGRGSCCANATNLALTRRGCQGTEPLQDRRCEPRVDDRSRDRRAIAQLGGAAKTRCEENIRTYTSWVESVEIYQPRSAGDHEQGNRDNRVLYDVEVARNHNYFANGVLVSNCKDPQAQQTRAIWHVMHQPSVQRRWALTGTPIANDPSDLWSIMHAVAPDDYPTRSAYVDRFCLQAWNAFGGLDVVGIRPDTRDEFFKILDPRFRRVLKAVVLPQLPPKVREVRYVDMTTGQARVYRELEERLVARTEDGQLLIAKSNLGAQTRLLQLAAATVDLVKPDPNDITTWQVSLREPAPKLDALEEVLDELGVLARGYIGPPVLIAAELKDLLRLTAERLTKIGVTHALFTGDVAPVDRERALNALREGRIRALLFTGKAGGVGLDMSASDTLINLQRSWSLVDEKQKEDRPHRPGAEVHECIRIIDVITRSTVEEVQVTRLHEKLQRLDEITRDRATLSRDGKTIELAALDAEEERLLSSSLGVPPS